MWFNYHNNDARVYSPYPQTNFLSHIRTRTGLDYVGLHDLHHTFASLAIASGISLPLVGALICHSQPRTAAKYVNMTSDPLNEAAELIAKKIAS